VLTVNEAQQMILDVAERLRPESAPLVEAVQRVLASDIESDIDSPPHDKALMDGFALVSSSLAASGGQLRVIETVTAGEVPTRSVGSGEATRIMTGAVIPTGADAVVMFEETESTETDVIIRAVPVVAEQNILRRGTVMRRGETVLRQGRLLSPTDIGLLGEVGCDPVPVAARPCLGVLATGNELVDAAKRPGEGAIRNSNGPMLAALGAHRGADVVSLGIGRDEPADLRQRISAGLDCDVLVLSGGVSAGDLDLVPQMLTELGVEPIFHGVQLKPGKPLWFGKRPASDDTKATLVFGLPGNPVSGLVCFHLFVAPALRKMAGEADTRPTTFVGHLAHEWSHRGGRPTYFPATARPDSQGVSVSLCPWKGSADQKSLVEANALVLLPKEPKEFAVNAIVEFQWLRPMC
jgi:molybdopterin molybdotransferase